MRLPEYSRAVIAAGMLSAGGFVPAPAAAQALRAALEDCRDPAFVGRLYEALIVPASSSAMPSVGIDSLAHTLRCAERLIEASPGDEAGWAAAGAAHLLVGWQGRSVFDSRAMRTGSTHLQASAAALLQALQLGSTRPHLPPMLWNALEEQDYWSQYGPAARAIRRIVASRSGVEPGLLLLRSRLAWRTGKRDSALVFARAYLAAGGDSSVGWRELARELARAGADDEAVAAYWRGLAASLSPAGTQLYKDDAQVVAGPAEAIAIRDTPPEALADSLARLWARRDVEAAREPGARIAEQFRRLEYALQHFRARKRRTNAGESRDLVERGAAFAPALDTAYAGDAVWLGSSFDQLRRRVHWLRDFDNRGIAYLRHGAPDERAGPFWLYIRGGEPLMIAVTPYQDQLPGTSCDLMPRYCALELETSLRPSRRQLELLWQQTAEMTTVLLESDGLAARFGRDLAAGIQIHGLAGTGRPGILVAVAIRGSGLIAAREAGGMVYRLRLRISALSGDGSRLQLDTTRTYYAGARLSGDQHLLFLQWVPAGPGTWDVGVALEQGAAATGAVVSLRGVHVPDPARTGLDMSDLVVGLESGPVRWWNGELEVPVNPLNVTSRRLSPQLYFELFGAAEGEEYRVTLTVRPRGGKRSPVTVQFREVAPRPSFTRTLQVPDLDPGVYDVTVGVSVDGGVETRRATVITVGD